MKSPLNARSNVAEALVSKGYATVVKYKAGEEHKSSQYDALYAAEQRAIEGKKGMHKDQSEWPQHRIMDTTTNKDLGKQFFSFLQRHQRLDAVCDHVIHGGRLKLYIPKQNTVIIVLLAGVKVPRTARPGEPGEPGAAEALAYTRDLCLQRNVEVTVDSMDKGGNYMGTVWANHQNVALGLVENGLAATNFAADRLPYASELFAAEQQAQARRVGVCRVVLHVAFPMQCVTVLSEALFLLLLAAVLIASEHLRFACFGPLSLSHSFRPSYSASTCINVYMLTCARPFLRTFADLEGLC